MPTRTYKLNFPVVGETTIAQWDFQCSPPVNEVRVPLVAAAGVDVELSLEKVKDAIGELGSLIPDERVNKFINAAKSLAPEGRIGIKVALQPETKVTWCPGFEKKRASYLSFILRLTVVGNVAGTYGIVTGKAYALLAFELASDTEFCECPEPPAGNISLDDFGAIGTTPELLLATGPVIAPPLLLSSAKPLSPLPEAVPPDAAPTADVCHATPEKGQEQEATLTVTDEHGITRVLAKYPLF